MRETVNKMLTANGIMGGVFWELCNARHDVRRYVPQELRARDEAAYMIDVGLTDEEQRELEGVAVELDKLYEDLKEIEKRYHGVRRRQMKRRKANG